MGKVWVLDSETKGTGAEMVPLEKVLRDSAEPGRGIVVPKPRERPPREPEPKAPPRFKVVDVMTRQVLVEGADTRATVDALRAVRSVVDVSIYVWDEGTESWRALGIGDRKLLLSFASR